MKPILRNLRTGLYFQGGATWTNSASDALVYTDLEAALDAAYTATMPDLELNVLLFDDSRYTIRLALDEFFRKLADQSPRVPPKNALWIWKARPQVGLRISGLNDLHAWKRCPPGSGG